MRFSQGALMSRTTDLILTGLLLAVCVATGYTMFSHGAAVWDFCARVMMSIITLHDMFAT